MLEGKCHKNLYVKGFHRKVSFLSFCKDLSNLGMTKGVWFCHSFVILLISLRKNSVARISETSDHIALANILRRSGIFFEHPPNGGYRRGQEGKLLKAMGVVRGSSDFRIYDSPPRWPEFVGVSFELKARDKGWSNVTKDQRAFLLALWSRNWLVGWGRMPFALCWLRWLGYPIR